MQYPVRDHAKMGMTALSSAANTASRMDRKRPKQKTTVGDTLVGAANTYALYTQGEKLAKRLTGGNEASTGKASWSRDNVSNLPEVQTPMEQASGQNPGTLDPLSGPNSFNQYEIRGTPEIQSTVQAPTPQGGPVGPPTGGSPPAPVPIGEQSGATSALGTADQALPAGEMVTPVSEAAEGAAEAGTLAEGATIAAEETAMIEGAAVAAEGAEVAEGAVAAAETAAAAEAAVGAGEVAASGTLAAEGAGAASGLTAMGPAGWAVLGAVTVGSLLWA